MKTAKDLAEKVFTKELYFDQISPLLESFSYLGQTLTKEIVWQFEGQYDKFFQIQVDSIESVLTSEQINKIYEFLEENPWAIDAYFKMAKVGVEKGHEWGEEISNIVLDNLEDTGDIEKVAKEIVESFNK
jgi:hypothetical protein